MKDPGGWAERLLSQRIERKLQLLRGATLRWRGAQTGARFGLGRGVDFQYPACFSCGDDVTIGDYSALHCLSERGVRFGSRTSIDRNLWLDCGGKPDDYGHGYFEIGSDSYIGCNAVIGAGGGVIIGSHVLIGQCVNFHAENHQFGRRDVLICEQGVTYEGIVVEDDVWIGSKAVLLDGVTVHRGAVIGAGALVTRSIPEYAIAVGSPARVAGYRGEGKYAHSNIS